MSVLSVANAVSVLKKKLGTECFEFLSCQEKVNNDISTGVLSSAGKAILTYRRGAAIEELQVFFKRLPDSKNHRDDVMALDVFRKEPLIYNKFFNCIKVKSDECFYPLCYLAKENEVLVLEDLSTKGYKNLPVLIDYDLDHCKQVTKTLAKFHAASMAFEIKNNCKLNEYIPDLDHENIFSTDENHVGRKRYDVGIKALQLVTETYISHYSSEVVRKAFEYMEKLPEKLHASKNYPNVITHCDLWNNNIMFKYDGNGQVTNSCLVDFQLCTYRPPSFDLQMFLYCCTSKAFRAEHYKYILVHYYICLKEELLRDDIQINSVLTVKHFENMCEETLPLAITLAPQFMHFVSVPDHLMKPIFADGKLWKEYYQIDRNTTVLKAFADCQEYKAKVIEGLSDLFEYFREL